MIPKLEKYTAERERNDKRIEALHARNATLDKLIAEQRNIELTTLLEDAGMSYQDLTAYIASRTGQDTPTTKDEEEDTYEHTETAGGEASAEEAE